MKFIREISAPAIVATALLALIGTSGCGPSPQNSEKKKPGVALVMKSLANEFFSTMAEGAQKSIPSQKEVLHAAKRLIMSPAI
jgi:ABC-type sugar transport system substrate-binding protein